MSAARDPPFKNGGRGGCASSVVGGMSAPGKSVGGGAGGGTGGLEGAGDRGLGGDPTGGLGDSNGLGCTADPLARSLRGVT